MSAKTPRRSVRFPIFPPAHGAPGLCSRPMPLVTFEGVEGCGKSTQLALAAERLRRSGRDVLATREPGEIGRAHV